MSRLAAELAGDHFISLFMCTISRQQQNATTTFRATEAISDRSLIVSRVISLSGSLQCPYCDRQGPESRSLRN